MKLEDYAKTPRQKAIVRMRDAGASWREVANHFEIDPRYAQRVCRAIQDRAAIHGYSPEHGMTKTVPDGFTVQGVSSYYDQEGKLTGQWVKSKSNNERQTELLLEAIDNSARALPAFKPSKPPKQVDEDLATLITITDFHLGMKAWEASDGANWDVTIARNVFMNAIHDMIDKSPASGTGILNQLGDFFHWDGLIQVTPTSGHHLTGDDRYSKLVEMTINIMTTVVKLMLKRFGKVVVIQAEGNHDLASSVWMRKYIKHRFADEPRVEVLDNEFPYYAYMHGSTMLGFHHGHKMRMGQLQKLFASEPRFRQLWGNAQHCYIHCGHLHHERVIEDAGATVEMHPTLASRDNYSSSNGYVSARGAKAITYDKVDGEVQRITVRPRE